MESIAFNFNFATDEIMSNGIVGGHPVVVQSGHFIGIIHSINSQSSGKIASALPWWKIVDQIAPSLSDYPYGFFW